MSELFNFNIARGGGMNLRDNSFSSTNKIMNSYAFIPDPKKLLLCVKRNRPRCTCILLRRLRCAKLKPMNLETIAIRINQTRSLTNFLPFYLWGTKLLRLLYLLFSFFLQMMEVGKPGHVIVKKKEKPYLTPVWIHDNRIVAKANQLMRVSEKKE